MADIGDGSGGIVRGGFYQDRDTVGGVPLVDHFLVGLFVFVGGFLDGRFHSILGHIGRFGVLNSGS